MKVISDPVHGILDYLTVVLFAVAPSVLGFTGAAAIIAYALAIVHLLMTVFTNMRLGLVKVIPVKLHAVVEMIVGPVLVVGALVLPNLFAGAQTFFVAVGIVIFGVWLLSSYSVAVPAKAFR